MYSNFISLFSSSKDEKHRTTRLLQAANCLNTYSIGFRFILALIRFFLGFSLINKLYTIHLKFCGEAVNAGKLQSKDIAELCDLQFHKPTTKPRQRWKKNFRASSLITNDSQQAATGIRVTTAENCSTQLLQISKAF